MGSNSGCGDDNGGDYDTSARRSDTEEGSGMSIDEEGSSCIHRMRAERRCMPVLFKDARKLSPWRNGQEWAKTTQVDLPAARRLRSSPRSYDP